MPYPSSPITIKRATNPRNRLRRKSCSIFLNFLIRNLSLLHHGQRKINKTNTKKISIIVVPITTIGIKVLKYKNLPAPTKPKYTTTENCTKDDGDHKNASCASHRRKCPDVMNCPTTCYLCKRWRENKRQEEREAAEMAKKIQKKQIKDERTLCRKEKLEKIKKSLGFGR